MVSKRRSVPKGRLQRAGFTLIELIIVISMIGILAAIAAPQFAARGAQLYANDVRAILLQGRYEAIKRNRPIAVVWNAAVGEFQTILGPSTEPCNAGTVLTRAAVTDYRRVVVDPGFAPAIPPAVGNGIVWLPTGQARACGFGVLPIATIAVISDPNVVREVVVSIAGRVTVQ